MEVGDGCGADLRRRSGVQRRVGRCDSLRQRRKIVSLIELVEGVAVFTDPATAAQQAKERARSYSKYVTAAPQPLDIGTNGLIAVGLSPDNSKAVTYLTFAEGRVGVDLEFDSYPTIPAPQDIVLAIARTQDQIVKNRMPS